MDRSKQRFNSSRSHKKAKRKTKEAAATAAVDQPDANAEIIVPKSQEQKELERREKLKQELLAQSESKVNSKKKKRLEKYIEKKLKQEERLVLFEKLSKTQAQLSTALQLQSSSSLGTGKPSTHKERLEREEDKEVRQAIAGQAKGKRRRQRATVPAFGADESDDEDDGLPSEPMEVDQVERGSSSQPEEGLSRATPIVVVDDGFSTSRVEEGPKISVIGSALQRNPDGSVVAPKIVKRKPKGAKATFASWGRGSKGQRAAAEADSDTSFNSSDSAYDSADEQDDDSGSENEAEGIEEDLDGSSESEKSSSHEAAPEEDDPQAGTKRKRLGFKAWAMQHLSVAKGYVAPLPSGDPESEKFSQEAEQAAPPPPKKRKVVSSTEPREMRGPLGEDLQLPSTSFAQHVQEASKKAQEAGTTPRRKVISVIRPPEVEESRLLLPIVAEEQPIMEAILLNSVVIICGETGSGKTTQVPQFLFEAGYGSPGTENPGMIGVTQPRRVAAMSMASRVAQELGLGSSRVSYQIRYDATVSPTTSIKFMTDGVLLRELSTDFLLTKYSVIIIDEAHERSMNTDILIGVLSRVIKLREDMWKEGKDGIKPLRLIIMSATLRVSDFAENKTLFASPPPVISVPARQHPVTIHFSRRTASDYVTEAIKKTVKIHTRLPPGGILIFLTGQNEISGVCKKLEARYGKKALEERKKMRESVRARLGGSESGTTESRMAVAPAQADVEAEDMDLGGSQEQDALAFDVDGDAQDEDADAEALDSDADSINDEELGIDVDESNVPMHVVPLYALLPSEKQMQVFQSPPPGSRFVVVSTNVAETSLTIPGIRYVVDCGRAKERRYDVSNGIQAFQVSWISKASAAQRAGRAGRTGPGHCYRLYSSALFENYFDQFSQPELLRMPIEGVVLQMKSMHIDSVVNFPFPTPPDRFSLQKAEKVLMHLGALTGSASSAPAAGTITEIGKAMSLFPLSPRFSRMLVSGRQHGCLPYVIAVVSALSVGDPFLREEALEGNVEESDDDEEDLSHLTSEAVKLKEVRRLRRKAFFQSQQTHASLGNGTSDVFKVLSVVGAYEYAGGGQKFCSEHFVRPKAMEEIHKLRAQISSIVQTNFPDLDAGFVPNLRPPSNLQLKVLRQLITAGFIDQVAVRKDIAQKGSASGEQYTTAKGVAYRALGISEDVFIHPSSVLFAKPPPDFVVFLEVVRTSRVYVKGLTVVNAVWLSNLGKSLCTYSKPVKNREGQSMIVPHFGPEGWELPAIKQD
ncbi:P-loop containing nucleoside triphosphate hydrolase protein [Obba rivulosa]|uniref:RNA helicase n=1 Tax=Obba rivulosa TaxID=1052685 RepID=A0A8E2AVL6_9APHY|nr:P-loop containing nucleoside triphosphate hydrolase protein [Obba rivulosa]